MSAAASVMSLSEASLRLAQQELVAGFGLFALKSGPLQALMDEACRVAAEGLGTTLAKVLRYRADADDFLVVAGVGWHAGVVGNGTLGSGLDSPAGFAMQSGLAILSNHLGAEDRFRTPPLLAEHGVQSAVNVLIGSVDEVRFGVLEVDSTRRHDFAAADTAFLQTLANVLAAGLQRAAAEAAQAELLREKDMLMQEVHHRVKNSLQLVRTMLGLQARTAPPETKLALDAAAGRIMSIAAVHHRLHDGASAVEGDVAVYLANLVQDMQAMVGGVAAGRVMALQVEPMMLAADRLTSLGLIVSELVTNAMKHGAGRVDITVSRAGSGIRVIVEDEGPGFANAGEGGASLGMRLVRALAKAGPEDAVEIDRSVPHGRIVVRLAG